jgi:ABC-type lipoprotein export system ATPase subunit
MDISTSIALNAREGPIRLAEFIGFRKSYVDERGRETSIFHGLNLVIPDAPLTAIIGASGTGKSTLFHAIGGLMCDYAGEIRILGQSVPSADGDAMRRHRQQVSIVFQNSNLVGYLDIAINAALPLLARGVPREQAREAATNALCELGLGDKLHRKPAQLSGGEKQRVAVARSLASGARLLLADEPSGALDARNRDKVLSLFDRVSTRGVRVIVVTHDEALARRCDQVFEITKDALGRRVVHHICAPPTTESAVVSEVASTR